MIPVVAISLPQSVERRTFMSAQMGHLGVPFRFFDAIDGRTLSATERARFDPSMPVGAMGCAESHLAVLRQVAGGADPFVCVIEDDAELLPTVASILDAAFLASLPAFDVLRLESSPRRRAAIRIARHDGLDIVAAVKGHPATTAQIFSKRGAERIIGGISYLRVAIDVALYLDCYLPGLRVLETRPSLCHACATFGSTIGAGRRPPYSALETFAYRRLRLREVRQFVSFARAWGLRALTARVA